MRTGQTYPWHEFINQKRSVLITCGLIIIPVIAYFVVKGYPLWIVNKDPINVGAEITYIYHTHGGKSSGMRYYEYKFQYNGKVYHGVTETNLNIILGDMGDTLIIRCNKNNPQYSVFQYPDNPDLRVRKLTGKEYYRILYQEPDENNNP